MKGQKPKNLWEDEVVVALKPLLAADPAICTCDQCQSDIQAYALNRLKPMYTTALGRGRMRYLLRAHRPQLRDELNMLLDQAIALVKERPRAECKRQQAASAAPMEPDRA